jgi:hypothetical protein
MYRKAHNSVQPSTQASQRADVIDISAFIATVVVNYD